MHPTPDVIDWTYTGNRLHPKAASSKIVSDCFNLKRESSSTLKNLEPGGP
jgi:hypothetical protein